MKSDGEGSNPDLDWRGYLDSSGIIMPCQRHRAIPGQSAAETEINILMQPDLHF